MTRCKARFILYSQRRCVEIRAKCQWLQGHHFQNLVPASWIPAGTSHFCSISLSREGVQFINHFHALPKRSASVHAWDEFNNAMHRVFLKFMGMIITGAVSPAILCAIILILRHSGHLRGNQNSLPRALFSGVSGYLVLFGLRQVKLCHHQYSPMQCCFSIGCFKSRHSQSEQSL